MLIMDAGQACHCSFSVVDCKTEFFQPDFTANSIVEVKVHLRSTAPLPITLSQLKIEFVREVSKCSLEGS